jgi:pimeloyl-ACP methyl ester carboxylesterase
MSDQINSEISPRPPVQDATASGAIAVDGAELYYEMRGRGPALLLITGAGGDAGFYTEAAVALADAFTVITYDRRGNSRSSGRTGSKISIAREASDARAVIDRCAGGRSVVFGNSAGAIIGLCLTANHPESVVGLIAHEPPIISILDDSQPERIGLLHVLKIAEEQGTAPAAEAFLGGFGDQIMAHWPPGLAERFGANLPHFFENEYSEIIGFTPDLGALKAVSVPIVMAVGAENRGRAVPVQLIADHLGVALAELPGGHLSFVDQPAAFAIAIRALASELFTRVEGIPAAWRSLGI